MSIFRRIIGFLMIIVAILGLVIAGAGAFFANRAIDATVAGLNSVVNTLNSTVGTSTDSLRNVQATLTEVGATLDTVSLTASNAATTLVDTQPLLEQVTTLTTETLPASLDAVNVAVPNLAGIAGTIDTTLSRLSDFQLERQFLGQSFNFDLGINYNPTEPFDEAVLQVGESLQDVPDQLRALEGNLQTSITNIGAVGGNIDQLSANIDGINTTVQEFIPLLDQYIAVLDQTTGSLENARAQVNANLNTIKLVATGLLAWFALYQIVPLYVGYRMLSDKVVEGTFEERVDELDGDAPAREAALTRRLEEDTADARAEARAAAERAQDAARHAEDAAENAANADITDETPRLAA